MVARILEPLLLESSNCEQTRRLENRTIGDWISLVSEGTHEKTVPSSLRLSVCQLSWTGGVGFACSSRERDLEGD